MKAPLPLAILLFLCSLTCHESLPLRSNPGDVFQGNIELHYILNSVENDIWFCARITNIFDETFQDTLLLRGSFTVTLEQDSSYHKTFVLSDANIIHGNYNRRTKIVTLDPDSSILLSYQWDMRDDDGRDVRARLMYSMDSVCEVRKLAQPTFLFSGQVKIINRTNPARFNGSRVTVTIADILVDPKFCDVVSNDTYCR